MPRKLTKGEVRARIALIAKLREQGLSIEEGARHCGIGRAGFVAFLQFHGIAWARKNPHWTQDEHDLAVRLRREGKSWPAIARAVGRGQGALEQYARAKFPDDLKPGGAKVREERPEIVVGGDARERLFALLQAGMSLANAARVTGHSEEAARALEADWRADGTLPEAPAPMPAPHQCRRYLSLRARVGEAKALEQWRYDQRRAALRRGGEAA